MSENNINVGGRLHSIATGNVVAGSDEILDDALGKKQSQVNVETYALVESVNNALASLSPEQQGALDVSEKANNNEVKLGYYVCQTEGNVAAKTIAAANYVLSAGGSIKIKMNNANTADNATLNINSTGAKALYYAGERASATNSWETGETVEVYYDGTSFYANSVAGGSGSGDGAFDISAKTGDTYETLTAALTAANSILSVSKKKGGMSIKFILRTNTGTEEAPVYKDEYVQYRLMNQSWSIDVTDWQGVDSEPTYESKNLIDSGGVYNALKDKANIEGYYDKLSVGLANSIRGTVVTENTFIKRDSGGSQSIDSGIAEIDHIYGNTIKFNQLYNDSVPTAKEGHKYYLKENNSDVYNKSISATISYTESSTDRMCIDLTNIFGTDAQIATALGIEESDITTNVGVAAFEFWLDVNVGTYDYYPYTDDSLITVNIKSIKTADSNDDTLDEVPFDITQVKGKLLDANDNPTGNSVVVFPDGLKKAGTVFDEIFVENGVIKAIKRVNSIDLGDKDYTEIEHSDGEHLIFRTSKLYCTSSGNANTNKIYNSYVGVNANAARALENLQIGLRNADSGYAYIRNDNYSDATTFKAAMDGVVLYYELRTYQTYLLDPTENKSLLQYIYKVDKDGTEEVTTEEGTITCAPTLGIRYSTDIYKYIEDNYLNIITDTQFNEIFV